MSRYKYPSDFYADDKDISDLLILNGFNVRQLIQMAMEKGIVLSPELSKETLVDYLALLPCSWPDLQSLLRTIESPDRREKLTNCRYSTQATLDDIERAIDSTRDIRGAMDDEAYNRRRTENGVLVRVFYSEMDAASTRTIQRTHKEMEIRIEPISGGYEVRYYDNVRSVAIIDKIFSLIPIPEGEKKPKPVSIDLSGVVTSGKRTEFFIRLIDGLDGFLRRDVVDLKVNRIGNLVEVNEALDDDAVEEEKEAEERLKNAVKKMSLSGESLLSSPQFQQLSDDGFAIYRIIWEAMEKKGAGRVFELEALFRNADLGRGFSYMIRGVYEKDEERDREVLRKTIPLDDRNRIHGLIEAAAYAALAEIRASIEAEANTEDTA